MRNGYFQIVCGEKETSLKIFLPEEGGKPVRIREVISYLTRNGVDFDTTGLNKGIMDSLGTTTGEYQFVINNKHYNEVRESYQMQVSQDKMLAIARFYPPSLNGERMTADEFFNDLEHKKIKFGILKKGLIKFFENPVYCADMVVVKGKLPRHGKDASIEYFFETNLCVKPTLKEDGSVDFFNLNTINHCKEGELLARLHPADLGDPGRTIYDEKIKPRDVKRLSIKGDRNSVLSDDRLELKVYVKYIEDRDTRLSMLAKKQAEDKATPLTGPTITLEELCEMQWEVSAVQIPAAVNELMDDILIELRRQGIHVSDRKYFGYYPIVQAHAWLCGREEAVGTDLTILRNYLWTTPDELPKISQVLTRLCENPLAGKISEIRKSIVDAAARFEQAPDGNVVRALQRFRTEAVEIYRKITGLRSYAQNDTETAQVDGLLEELEKASQKAHAATNLTYIPMNELEALIGPGGQS